MKERGARHRRCENQLDASIRKDHYGVLPDACGWSPQITRHFEPMTMQMHRVAFVALVLNCHAITSSLLEHLLQGSLPLVRFASDGPALKAVFCDRQANKPQSDLFVGFAPPVLAEDAIVPNGRGEICPPCFSVLSCIFHDDAKPLPSDIVVDGSQHPDTGHIHLDNRVDAFPHSDRENIDHRGPRDLVPVQSHNEKLVSGKSQLKALRSARIEKMEEDTLPSGNADRIAMSQRLTV